MKYNTADCRKTGQVSSAAKKIQPLPTDAFCGSASEEVGFQKVSLRRIGSEDSFAVQGSRSSHNLNAEHKRGCTQCKT